jgi:hypothetical protein
VLFNPAMRAPATSRCGHQRPLMKVSNAPIIQMACTRVAPAIPRQLYAALADAPFAREHPRITRRRPRQLLPRPISRRQRPLPRSTPQSLGARRNALLLLILLVLEDGPVKHLHDAPQVSSTIDCTAPRHDPSPLSLPRTQDHRTQDHPRRASSREAFVGIVSGPLGSINRQHAM